CAGFSFSVIQSWMFISICFRNIKLLANYVDIEHDFTAIMGGYALFGLMSFVLPIIILKKCIKEIYFPVIEWILFSTYPWKLSSIVIAYMYTCFDLFNYFQLMFFLKGAQVQDGQTEDNLHFTMHKKQKLHI
ncbi:hypothetical protein ACJX0J_025256, partial [Zea mays]